MAALLCEPNSAVRASLPDCAGPSAFDVFDLSNDSAYQSWRAAKLAQRARSSDELVVDIVNPLALSATEREALLGKCARWNMAVYRCTGPDAPASPDQHRCCARALGQQLGLHRLAGNWLADEDGISSIEVRGIEATGEGSSGSKGQGFIPYTDRALKWHTDGYYTPSALPIRAMTLHCVRDAATGGVNTLLDHELAYIAVRDANPDWVRALMAPDAMTIPGREGDKGIARAAQSGPVFVVDTPSGGLCMRYTARTHSIAWRQDADTAQAVDFLARYLAAENPDFLKLRLEPGMGIVANNVLHARSAFTEDAEHPRLIFRARYLDPITDPATAPQRNQEPACRNG